jgi:hypothetical protein
VLRDIDIHPYGVDRTILVIDRFRCDAFAVIVYVLFVEQVDSRTIESSRQIFEDGSSRIGFIRGSRLLQTV